MAIKLKIKRHSYDNQSPAKEAQDRFHFKHKVCYEVCGLYKGKGGFCDANRSQIDFCLEEERKRLDCRNYRSKETTLEFLQSFYEEDKIPFLPTKETFGKIDVALKKTKKDCYQIALEIYENENWQN
jgi:hypothetical protein